MWDEDGRRVGYGVVKVKDVKWEDGQVGSREGGHMKRTI